MKKVLHISGRASYDGTCIYPVRLARDLTEVESTVLFISGGSALKEIKNLNIKVIVLLKEGKLLFGKIRAIFKFLSVILNNKFDIIHYQSGGITFLFLSVLFSKKKKVIHHLQCGNLNCKKYADKLSAIEHLIYKIIGNRIIKVAVADHVALRYSSEFGSKNLLVIKNTVPGNFEEKAALNYNIGYVGQIDKHKNFSEITKLLEVIKKSGLNLKIIIKGDIWGDISFLSNYKEYINILPPSLDTSEFYKTIDLLFFPSKGVFEGIPLVVLEGINYDTGIISLNSKAVNEVFIDYPLMLDNFNELNLSEILNNYYRNDILKKKLSAIHERISENFSYDKMLKQIAGIYSKL